MLQAALNGAEVAAPRGELREGQLRLLLTLRGSEEKKEADVHKSIANLARTLSSLTLMAPSMLALAGRRGANGPLPRARELIGGSEMFADASRFRGLVWTAGHLPGGQGSFEEQVVRVLDSLETTLAAAGAGFDTLLKTNVYLLDWDDWETFNRIYVERIGSFGTPPRTTVQVARLAPGFGRIEIEMVAHVRELSQ
jgi:2-iminobutanoate/2-iminopropanoate deaminase